MSLYTTIKADLLASRKSGDTSRTSDLIGIIDGADKRLDTQNEVIRKKCKKTGTDFAPLVMTDELVIAEIKNQVKNLNESIDQVNNPYAEGCMSVTVIRLEEYLPKQLTEAELTAKIYGLEFSNIGQGMQAIVKLAADEDFDFDKGMASKIIRGSL
jgi:hypothetical protein